MDDLVVDPNTYKKYWNVRASMYKVIYILDDGKTLLIAKPKLHILKKSKYLNEKWQKTISII